MRPDVDDMIRQFDHIGIMFNNNDRIALIPKLPQ
jgi:hypothetical protein